MNEIEKKCKSFGIFFSTVFTIISIYLYYKNSNFYLIYFFILLSLFFLIVLILKPTMFRVLNFIWRQFGVFLGMIISPIILSIIYFFLFTLYKVFLIILRVVLQKKTFSNTNFYFERSLGGLTLVKRVQRDGHLGRCIHPPLFVQRSVYITSI